MKGVNAPDARPEDVAGVKRELLAIGHRADLAFDHVVGLFEWVVVGLRDAARLVLDHEHLVEHGAEALVDQHLDRDPAVGQQCRRHARRHGWRIDSGADLEVVDVHLAGAQAEERARPRVSDIERRSAVAARHGLARPERVGLTGEARRRRVHGDPQRIAVGVVGPGVRNPDGHESAVVGSESVRPPVDGQGRVAGEDVEALLGRVQVRVDMPARLQ